MGGACCGGATFYPEIDEATSLSELSKFLREKQDFVVKQAEEIKEYIEDKGKIPRSIEVASIQENHLEKRMRYLGDYKKGLVDAHDIISSDSRINLDRAKDAVHRLWDYFFVEFDDTLEYTKVIKQLEALSKSD